MELKVSVAAEGLYIKIPKSTSHVVFTEKTELRNVGEPHLSVSDKCHIFKL